MHYFGVAKGLCAKFVKLELVLVCLMFYVVELLLYTCYYWLKLNFYTNYCFKYLMFYFVIKEKKIEIGIWYIINIVCQICKIPMINFSSK